MIDRPRDHDRRRPPHRRPSAAALVAVLLAGATLAGCGSDASSPPAETAATAPSATASNASNASNAAETFVGSIEGTALRLAAVVQGTDVLVYLCDGASGARAAGRLSDGSAAIEVPGAGSLQLTAADHALTGSLLTGTDRHAVNATPATGAAGLLWAKGTDAQGKAISAGWIVAADGQETGGVVTGISDGTSNTLQLAGALPSDRQKGIIAILIGLRTPLETAR